MKTDPDEYLAAHGPAAIAALLNAAVPADPLERLEATLSSAADPTAVAELLDDLPLFVSLLEVPPGTQYAARMRFSKHRAGGRFDDALKLAKQKVVDAATRGRAGDIVETQFEVVDGRLCIMWKSVPHFLASFDARIVRDIVTDDGVSRTRSFEIVGTTQEGEPLPQVTVTPGELACDNWPMKHWGSVATISAGRGHTDLLREAVQRRSQPELCHVFVHTGWRDVNGEIAFLTATGAIGEAPGIVVKLDDGLARYRLPLVATRPDQAVQRVLSILDVASPRIAVPLLLAMFRAPIQSIFPMDATLHLFGASGTFKSSLAALALCLFGNFTATTLPASFGSTDAALERKCFLAKDVPLVVDEATPASADDHDKIRQRAANFFRNQGNRTTRSRMRSDMTARPDNPPRCLAITTGEDTPSATTEMARVLAIEVSRGDVDSRVLGDLQRVRNEFPHAMTAFVNWLRPRLGLLGLWAEDRHRELCGELGVRSAGHARSAPNIAHLALAADLIAEFCVELGVFDATDATDFVSHCHRGLRDAAARHEGSAHSAKPGRRFLEVLALLLRRGEVHLVEDTGAKHAPTLDRASTSTMIGWRRQRPSGVRILLLPRAAIHAAGVHLKLQGAGVFAREGQIWRDLRADGLIEPGDGGHSTVKRMIAGKAERVIDLDAAALDAPNLGEVEVSGDDDSNALDDVDPPPQRLRLVPIRKP